MALSLRDAALYYASRGIPVFPLEDRGKFPRISKEKGGRGVLDATTDAAQVSEWWGKWPNANIGGRCAVFEVLDIDPDKGGDETLLNYDPVVGCPEVRTPSGGAHLYCKPEGLTGTVGFLPGLDWRGAGNYVVLPPSKDDRGEWRWVQNLGNPLADVPQWVKDAIGKPRGPATISEKVPDGERNATLFRFASLQRRMGMDEREILAALVVVNETKCDPPLRIDELKRIAESAARYQPAPVVTETQFDEPPMNVSGWIGEFRTDGRATGCPTGFNLIDANNRTGGAPDGHLSIVGAYTGHGKSTLMAQMALHTALKGEEVAYVTIIDLTREDIYDMMVSMLCGWYGGSPPSDPQMLQEWSDARAKVESLPIQIMDNSLKRNGGAIGPILSWLDTRPNARVAFIDYVQKLKVAERLSQYEQGVAACEELRRYAANRKMPIWGASQLTVGSKSEGQEDITKGCRDWEEAAGIFFKVKKIKEADAEKLEYPYNTIPNIAKMTIQKSRFRGGGLESYVQFDKKRGRYTEL